MVHRRERVLDGLRFAGVPKPTRAARFGVTDLRFGEDVRRRGDPVPGLRTDRRGGLSEVRRGDRFLLLPSSTRLALAEE